MEDTDLLSAIFCSFVQCKYCLAHSSMICFERNKLRFLLSSELVFECINCGSHIWFTVVGEMVVDLKLMPTLCVF